MDFSSLLDHPHKWMQTFHLFCTQKKTTFFVFTHQFLQNTCISLSILHIYLIKYSFFYNFLLFPQSLPFSFTDPTLPMITPHPATIITHPTSIIKENQPIQSETQIITHPTWNPLIKQWEISGDQRSERLRGSGDRRFDQASWWSDDLIRQSVRD